MAYVPQAGMQNLLKDGSKHLAGKDDAVLKNIDACKQLGNILRTSLGPNGMNKMVINYIGNLFVTSDAATIVRELEVIHPAAKLMIKASQAQERETGDGTGFVIVFTAKLLEHAEDLLRMGLHPSEIIDGYELAGKKVLEFMETLFVHKISDVQDQDQVAECLKTAIASKQFGLEDFLAPLVAKACIQILPKNLNNFNVENVRVAKVLGGTLSDSLLVNGAVLTYDVEGTIKKVSQAKVALFSCDVDAAQSETKGTVLLTSADELLNYTKTEENDMEAKIKAIAEAGTNVIVSPKFGETAMHFVEKYKIMAVKCTSKFELRRIARTCGAIALQSLQVPTIDEVGNCDIVAVEEFGSTKCTIFRQEKEGSRISTILLRAATSNVLDDIERAIDDAANVYRGILKDPSFIAGAGASDMELSRQLHAFASTLPGLDQYAVKKYAEALEIIPKTLAENAGEHYADTIANLRASHVKGDLNAGVDVETGRVLDAVEKRIFDLHLTKFWGLKLSTEAACTILRVDQIIMARTAGGPKPRDMMPGDHNDDAP